MEFNDTSQMEGNISGTDAGMDQCNNRSVRLTDRLTTLLDPEIRNALGASLYCGNAAPIAALILKPVIEPVLQRFESGITSMRRGRGRNT